MNVAASLKDKAPSCFMRSSNVALTEAGWVWSRVQPMVVANGGRLYVRNLPPSECMFVVDLPRHIRSTHFATVRLRVGSAFELVVHPTDPDDDRGSRRHAAPLHSCK